MLETRHIEHSHESVQEFINSANASPSEYLFGIFLKNRNFHKGNIRLHGKMLILSLVRLDCSLVKSASGGKDMQLKPSI
jgi:hypothetical protein